MLRTTEPGKNPSSPKISSKARIGFLSGDKGITICSKGIFRFCNKALTGELTISVIYLFHKWILVTIGLKTTAQKGGCLLVLKTRQTVPFCLFRIQQTGVVLSRRYTVTVVYFMGKEKIPITLMLLFAIVIYSKQYTDIHLFRLQFRLTVI